VVVRGANKVTKKSDGSAPQQQKPRLKLSESAARVFDASHTAKHARDEQVHTQTMEKRAKREAQAEKRIKAMRAKIGSQDAATRATWNARYHVMREQGTAEGTSDDAYNE
jgi:hypothetical protein